MHVYNRALRRWEKVQPPKMADSVRKAIARQAFRDGAPFHELVAIGKNK